jgi:hypothetical protein
VPAHSPDLIAQLKEKDELIIELKRVLLGREQRINQLELALAGGEQGRSSIPQGTEVVDGYTAGPLSTDFGGQAAEQSAIDPLLAAGTTGVYTDLWTDVEAVLQFSETLLGRVVRLEFFAPATAGAQTKPIAISPNFGEPLELSLTRGEAMFRDFAIPAVPTSAPEIRIRVSEPEPPSVRDTRRLGVKLSLISVDDDDVQPEHSEDGPR